MKRKGNLRERRSEVVAAGGPRLLAAAAVRLRYGSYIEYSIK
jgi:hypothetical protein